MKNKEDNYKVYIHTNKENGKKYVGITGKKVEQRWQEGRGYSVYTDFGKDIYEKGWDSFEHKIMNENISKNLAVELEKFYIRYYNTTNKYNGYNTQCGEFIGEKWSNLKKEKRDKIELEKGIGLELKNKISVIREYAKENKKVCVFGVWVEVLNREGKPTRADSNDITIILNNIEFLMPCNSVSRVAKYGKAKAWINKSIS